LGDVTFYGIAGLLGVVIYLAAYGALQLGLLRGSSLAYTLLNMLAAASILFSLLENWNLFSAVIQAFWILISIVGITRRVWLRSRLSFSPEEEGFLAAHLPTLAPVDAHRVTRIGRWEDRPPGAHLAHEGQPVGALIYLAGGRAEVIVGGRIIATLAPGALVGEMTVMHGGPATADVRVVTPARVLVLPRDRLMAEIRASPDIGLALGHALQGEVQRKLQAMNAAH
jgi:hypothetical protein